MRSDCVSWKTLWHVLKTHVQVRKSWKADEDETSGVDQHMQEVNLQVDTVKKIREIMTKVGRFARYVRDKGDGNETWVDSKKLT